MKFFKRSNCDRDISRMVPKYNNSSKIYVYRQTFATDIPKGEYVVVRYDDGQYVYNADNFTEEQAVEVSSRLRMQW